MCPGPSLARFRVGTDADTGLLIAINRACEYTQCGWWVFGDFVAPDLFNPVGTPRWCIDDSAFYRLSQCRPGLIPDDAIQWSCLVMDMPNPPYGWRVYSSCAAVVLAKHLGATSVSVFGADRRGDTDWDGTQRDGRACHRWKKESKVWDAVIAWARVNVVEHRDH